MGRTTATPAVPPDPARAKPAMPGRERRPVVQPARPAESNATANATTPASLQAYLHQAHTRPTDMAHKLLTPTRRGRNSAAWTFAAASSLNRRGLASNVMGGLRLDQSNLGRSDCSLRVSLRRAAGQSRLVMRRRSMRLGDIFGRRAGLCGRLGPAGATQLLLEAGHVRPLEADLSALIIAYRE